MAAINEFIKKRPGLVWSTMQYDKLSEEAIVEAVLNYGDFDDVNEMIKILGMNSVARIFRKDCWKYRCNYRPEVKNYFTLYFDKHDPRNKWYEKIADFLLMQIKIEVTKY
jgi:hypothetical protein